MRFPAVIETIKGLRGTSVMTGVQIEMCHSTEPWGAILMHTQRAVRQTVSPGTRTCPYLTLDQRDSWSNRTETSRDLEVALV